jgi:hypothetical protein
MVGAIVHDSILHRVDAIDDEARASLCNQFAGAFDFWGESGKGCLLACIPGSSGIVVSSKDNEQLSNKVEGATKNQK